jgi:hypothetical protein
MRKRTPILASLFVWVACSVLSSALLAEEPKAWRSWQIDNPAWAGLLSAATLGAWPSHFANDIRPAPVFQVQAIADGALDYTRAHSEKAFRLWRRVGFGAEAALITGIWVWRRRHRHRSTAALPAS